LTEQVSPEEDAQRSVTERIEREEFARGHIAPDEAPAAPRDAATIVLAREPVEGPFEVLLLKRPHTSRFAAGAFVFPGGTIDPADADEALINRLPSTGPDAEPSAIMAALRELFEETGLLLGSHLPGDQRTTLRHQLLEERVLFRGILEDYELSFAPLDICYFARWVTPARFSRRYDTRFFLATLPSDQSGFEPELTDEMTDFVWLTPKRAIDLFRGGRLPMLFPTRVTLQALAEFSSVEEMTTVFASRRVEPLTPRLLIKGNSIRPVLPGDPEYEQADV
jgi:8-oxo-dGTP pyrophosphatase MutT (NUDIX family)